MPNRILKESICTSETINQLSEGEENFFYRILVNCDDYGRMDARPLILLARCYPLRIGQITEEEIERRLAALVRAGLIELYVVDGTRYLQVVSWGKHQQIRNKRSKCPSPDDGELISIDINCNQLQSTDSNCFSESESESESIYTLSKESVVGRDDQRQAVNNNGKVTEQIKEVFNFYNEIFRDCWARPLLLTEQRRKKIAARLKRFSVEELKTAIRNIRASPFHCGENEKGRVYATPEFVFRSDEVVDRWLNEKPKTGGMRGYNPPKVME